MMLKLLTICLFVAAAISSSQHRLRFPAASIPPSQVYEYLVTNTTRYKHNFFHTIRNSFALLDELEQRQIENLGWKPPHISLTYTPEGNPIPIIGLAGEDFLFMNRKMIKKVNRIAIEASSAWSVDGWTECPDPTDPDWPVPPVPGNLDDQEYANYLSAYKTDDFYNNIIVPAEDFLADDDNMRALTFGELGVKLQFELFTYLLLRFSDSNPIGYRKQSSHPTAFVNETWNDEDYDFLGDFYSAHVNPTFWKISGWMERQINRWEIVNLPMWGLVTWLSTWEGGPIEMLPELFEVATGVKNDVDEGENFETPEIGMIAIAILALILSIGALGCICAMKKNMKNRAVIPMREYENRPLKIYDERLETDNK